MNNETLLAAIDLGSNSFRLEICRYSHGLIQRVEYIKETVRQGNGLDADRNLSTAAMERGWDCLLYTSPSPRDRQKSRMPSSA